MFLVLLPALPRPRERWGLQHCPVKHHNRDIRHYYAETSKFNTQGLQKVNEIVPLNKDLP